MSAWASGLLVFLLTILFEGLVILDLKALLANQVYRSATYSALLTLIGALIVVVYVDNKLMIIPDVLGSFFGTVIFLKFKKWQQ